MKSVFIALVAACLALASGFALGDGRPEAPFDIREDVRRAQEFLNHHQSGYTVTVERKLLLVGK